MPTYELNFRYVRQNKQKGLAIVLSERLDFDTFDIFRYFLFHFT